MWCPVQNAWGRTYPKTTTAVVDIMIAKYNGTILSKNMGKASSARAFASSKVDNKKWWSFKIYRIGLDILRFYSSSDAAHNYIYDLLIDM